MQGLADHSVVKAGQGLAELWHSDQVRKYSGYRYVTHCERVACLTAMACPNPDVVAAAWLHDILEDTSCPRSVIVHHCGTRTLEFVLEVTDVSRPEDGNRATRKGLDRDHLAKASAGGQTIKLADLIDNTMNIAFFDPDFSRTYLAEKRNALEVLTDGSPALQVIAWDVLVLAENHLMDCQTARRIGWPPA